MAERRPIVLVDGDLRELPVGDTLPGGGGGSSTFTGLTDTPADFTGQALKALRVNAGETALEYIDFPAGGGGSAANTYSASNKWFGARLLFTDFTGGTTGAWYAITSTDSTISLEGTDPYGAYNANGSFTVPNNVSKIRIKAAVAPEGAPGDNQIILQKNGTNLTFGNGGFQGEVGEDSYGNGGENLTSAILDVVPGDIFRLALFRAINTPIWNGWLEIEFIEHTLGDYQLMEAPYDPDAKTRWRVRGTVAGSFSGGALAKVIFKDRFGNPAYGAVSAGSEAYGGTAYQAFFGNGTTQHWAGTDNAVTAGTSWLAQVFGVPVNITTVEIIARDSTDSNQMWDEFVLEYSDDGTTWVVVQTFDSSAAWTSNELKTFTRTEPVRRVSANYLGGFRQGSNLSSGNVTLGAVNSRNKVIACVVGQQDSVYLGMTLGSVTGKPIKVHKNGDFEAMSWFEFKGISGGASLAYTLDNGGATLFRHSVFFWEVPYDSSVEWYWGGPINQAGSFNFAAENGDSILIAGSVSGSGISTTGTGFTADAASTLVSTTFYSAAFSKDLTADTTNDPFTFGETGGGDDRTYVSALIVKLDSGPAIYTIEEKDKVATVFPTIQETIDAATYSTVNADFLGGKFKKVRQACTITVEPGMTNNQPCSLIATTAGMITFAAGTGVTIVSPGSLLSTRVAGSPVTLIQDDEFPNTYYLFGDLA